MKKSLTKKIRMKKNNEEDDDSLIPVLSKKNDTE